MDPLHDPPGEELLRLALEHAPTGVVLADALHRVLLINAEAARLLGRDADALRGQPLDALLPERLRGQRTLAPGPSGQERFELPGLANDGKERMLEWRVQRVLGGTHLAIAVAELAPEDASDARFEAAVESAPSAMILIDKDGVIQFVNRETERLFGGSRQKLVGMRVDELVPERLRGGHKHLRDGYLAAPSMRPMGSNRELFARRLDGSEMPVEIALNPIRTGGSMFVLASIVDISARKEAERAQRERDERDRQRQKLESIGTLAGGIAHDFNNVLGGIVGYTELVQRAIGENDAVQADLNQVLRAADRGRQLVQRILMFSRQREATRTPMRLERTVNEVLELLRATLPTSIEVRPQIDPATPAILSDETELHQVLLNLATNASHAMEQGGVLEVQVAPYKVDALFARRHEGLQPGLHARLTVIDNGHGMSPEVRARVFEPFYTTKPAGKGSGLGLSVIHGIVQSLGGAIELWSEPGVGTRVDLLFPAYTGEFAPDANAASGGGEPEPRHILLVEDEVALAAMEKRQLESLGFRVTAHSSSIDALEDFRSRPDHFDMLVTDNSMPRMTGLQLAREILAMRPKLPVLMVSGIAETAEAEKLADAGIGGVLPKPHTARELGDAIAQLLGGK